MRTKTKQNKQKNQKVTEANMNQLKILQHNLGAKTASFYFLPIHQVKQSLETIYLLIKSTGSKLRNLFFKSVSIYND